MTTSSISPSSLHLSFKEQYILERQLFDSLQGKIFSGFQRVKLDKGNKIIALPIVAKVALRNLIENHLNRCGDNTLEDLRGEISIYKQLQAHPHVNTIRLVEVIEDPDKTILIMERGVNGDLLDFLQKVEDIFTEEDAREMFKGILGGVYHLHHSLGVCHLDISLENIVLDELLCPKLCDFGLARKCKKDSMLSFKQVSPPGKAKYMAPEVAERKAFNGFSADVYSMGIVLFCLLFRYHPYSQPSVMDPDYALVKKGKADLLMDNNIPISVEGRDLIMKMLDPDPSSRISMESIFKHPWLHSEDEKF